MLIKVRISDISNVIYENKAEMVIIPEESGELGVLYGHVNMIVTLTKGVIKIFRHQVADKIIKINGGFANINATNIEIII